jgi:hypothetical protein
VRCHETKCPLLTGLFSLFLSLALSLSLSAVVTFLPEGVIVGFCMELLVTKQIIGGEQKFPHAPSPRGAGGVGVMEARPLSAPAEILEILKGMEVYIYIYLFQSIQIKRNAEHNQDNAVHMDQPNSW